MITSSDVHAAAGRIAGYIRTTPLIEADPGTFPAGRVWLKLEQLQHTGSFKARGAFNRIRWASGQGLLPAAGVVTASGGNAGLAVAYAAARHNLPARGYVPAAAPAVKVARLRDYGACVVQGGSGYADAYEAAAKHAAEAGALFCHAYDQPEICAGQGTLGLELLGQTGGQLDTVLVAVGGGGIALANMAALALHLAFFGGVIGAVALALAAATGRRALASAGAASFAVFGFFVNGFAPLVHAVDWLKYLSIFHYYDGDDPLTNGVDAGQLAVLATTTIVLVALAVVGMRRRDLRR